MKKPAIPPGPAFIYWDMRECHRENCESKITYLRTLYVRICDQLWENKAYMAQIEKKFVFVTNGVYQQASKLTS